MYRIKTIGPKGTVIAKELIEDFEKAKKVFRSRITEYYSDTVERFVEQIKAYSKKYYGSDTPEEIDSFINMLLEIVKNPNSSDNVKDYGNLSFNDERMYISAMDSFVGITAFTIEMVKERLFPTGEIRIFNMDDPENDYYILFSNNIDECIYISLKYTEEDTFSEEDDDYEHDVINPFIPDEEDEFFEDDSEFDFDTEDEEDGFLHFDFTGRKCEIQEDCNEDSEEGFLDFDFSGRKSQVPGHEGDLFLKEKDDEDNNNRCVKCYYYDSCDENESGGLYCPSFRKK